MRETLAALTRNPLSLLGSALSMTTGILLVTLISFEIFGGSEHPYIGIITYMILPTVFAAGLIMIVWGILRHRHRLETAEFPVIDLNQERIRRRLFHLLVLVSISAVVLATVTFKAVGFMESNTFCGEVCHTVMTPEYTAYQRSPHARVHCVDCHIGPGANWFVKSKISGAWQVIAVTFDLYERPIQTPVKNLRPSKATCEQCHWPTKFHGTQPKVITRFAEDEANTQTRTILMMKVGGHNFAESRGIHWHVDPDVLIRYRSDESREQIYEVELTRADGPPKRYVANGAADDGRSEWRTMDCIDCHNRPAHVFYDAEEAVDLTFERGFVKKDLPYLKREAIRAVRAEYASHEEARKGIADAIEGFYRTEYPELAAERAADIEEAGQVLGDAYATNVFPTMKLDWGTYPNHIGHNQGSPGCFRCHAGDHATPTGETISVDCRICHDIVAWDEASPQILNLLEHHSPAVR